MNIDNLSLLSSPINLAKKYPIKPYKKNKEKEIKILVITKSKLKKKRFEYFAKTAKFIKKTKIIEKNKTAKTIQNWYIITLVLKFAYSISRFRLTGITIFYQFVQLALKQF